MYTLPLILKDSRYFIILNVSSVLICRAVANQKQHEDLLHWPQKKDIFLLIWFDVVVFPGIVWIILKENPYW